MFSFFPKSAKEFLCHVLSKTGLNFFLKYVSSQTLLDPDPSMDCTATTVTALKSQYFSGDSDSNIVWAQK